MFFQGRTLLKFDLLKKILELLPEEKLKLIHSNGSLLTKEIVEWINKKNISLSLSLNGVEDGEKNVNEMLKKSQFKGDLISLINSINHLILRKVALKQESKEDLLISIYSLHQTFPKAKINLFWDYGI
jgi:hypothetical protein